MAERIEAERFILQNLNLVAPRDVPELKLYRAHPASGLKRLTGEDAPPPYWAYGWAGGTVLARFILDHPEAVCGKRVVDFGTGSGLVAIAAAQAGAKTVLAIDSDPHAVTVARLNAHANDVTIEFQTRDAFNGGVPDADLVTGGDVFYAADLAGRVTACFNAFVTAGLEVLVGDPGRAFLPKARLIPLMSYTVEDFGLAAGTVTPASTVYRFRSIADPSQNLL